jgi:hypothetical protein
VRTTKGIVLLSAVVAIGCETPVDTTESGVPGRFMGECSDRDKADCQAAYAAIKALHAEVASCQGDDDCVPVSTRLEGGPRCDITFSCPFAVRRDVNVTELSARVKAISGRGCDACAEMCPPVPCPGPAPAAACNPTNHLCQPRWP